MQTSSIKVWKVWSISPTHLMWPSRKFNTLLHDNECSFCLSQATHSQSPVSHIHLWVLAPSRMATNVWIFYSRVATSKDNIIYIGSYDKWSEFWLVIGKYIKLIICTLLFCTMHYCTIFLNITNIITKLLLNITQHFIISQNVISKYYINITMHCTALQSSYHLQHFQCSNFIFGNETLNRPKCNYCSQTLS